MNGTLQEKITVFINDKQIKVDAGTSVADVCARAGFVFPKLFAADEVKTSFFDVFYQVAVDGQDKFVNAFDTFVSDGMKISTRTPELTALKKKAVDDLFEKHNVDCMMCEKAGDCFLQKLYLAYGQGQCGKKRMHSVPLLEKVSPFVSYCRERCIGCGRCVSFLKNMTGKDDLILKDGKVVIQAEKGVVSELSGNLTDICPAGAMVSSKAKDMFRSWNVSCQKGVDITDTVCMQIALNEASGKIVRVYPTGSDLWMTDKSRFSIDALAVNRLDKPYVRKNGELIPCSWEYAALLIAEKIKQTPVEKTGALIGPSSDCESIMALRDWYASMGIKSIELSQRRFYAEPSAPASWLFNTMLDKIVEADALLMIGVNVRYDAPAVNARLRCNPMPKALLGEPVDLTYSYTYLGNSTSLLKEIENGTQSFCSVLQKAKKPMLIVGEDALSCSDGAAVLGMCRRIAEKYHMVNDEWNGFNFIAHYASTIGALALGFLPCEPITPMFDAGKFDFVYLLNANYTAEKKEGDFIVYQGIFANDAVDKADIVLPSLSSVEKKGTFVSLEGCVRRTESVLTPLGSAREDWKIFRFLSEYTHEAVLPYDDLSTLRDHLTGESVIFYNNGEPLYADWCSFGSDADVNDRSFSLKKTEKLNEETYSPTVREVFRTEIGKDK